MLLTCLAIFYLIIGFLELFHIPISKKFLCISCLLPAFVLTAFRDVSVGCDTLSYLRNFTRIGFSNNLADAFLYSRMELGYVSITYFFSHFWKSFLLQQVLVTLFIYISFYFFLVKYSKNIGLSCFIFLTMRLMFGPMNVVRMYIAIGILLFSIPYLIKSNFLKFFLFVAVAALFHKTAFVFLLLYPLMKVKLNKKKLAIAFISSTIIGWLGKSFFSIFAAKIGLYEGYIDGKYFNYSGNIAIYIILAIDVCLALFVLYNEYFFKKKYCYLNDSESKETDISKVCFNAIVLIICFDLIGLGNTIMSRISGYFDFAWIIIIPLVFSRIRNRIASMVVLIIIAICLIAQYEVVMIYRSNWNCIDPFYFWNQFTLF